MQTRKLQNAADLRLIIQIISQLTEKNFIIDPRAQRKVTIISRKPMLLDEIYQVFYRCCKILNDAAIPAMQAKEYEGILSQQQGKAGDQVIIGVVPVNNISASQLISVLRPLMQEWRSTSDYEPANTLIMAEEAQMILIDWLLLFHDMV